MQVEGGVERILGNVGSSIKLQVGIRIECQQGRDCRAEWDGGDRLPVRAWHVGALARCSNVCSHLVKQNNSSYLLKSKTTKNVPVLLNRKKKKKMWIHF